MKDKNIYVKNQIYIILKKNFYSNKGIKIFNNVIVNFLYFFLILHKILMILLILIMIINKKNK